MDSMTKFNRIMFLVIGGLAGLFLLLLLLLSLMQGRDYPINYIILMIASFAGAAWGYKELKK